MQKRMPKTCLARDLLSETFVVQANTQDSSIRLAGHMLLTDSKFRERAQVSVELVLISTHS